MLETSYMNEIQSHYTLHSVKIDEAVNLYNKPNIIIHLVNISALTSHKFPARNSKKDISWPATTHTHTHGHDNNYDNTRHTQVRYRMLYTYVDIITTNTHLIYFLLHFFFDLVTRYNHGASSFFDGKIMVVHV